MDAAQFSRKSIPPYHLLHDSNALDNHTFLSVDAHHVHASVELGHVQSEFVSIELGVVDHLTEDAHQGRSPQ